MAFPIPTLAQMREFVVALGKALFPSLNFGSTRSYHGKWSTFLSGAVTQLHAHVDSAQKDLHPLTASEGKPINDWGSAVGLPRKSATPARKTAAGRSRGEAAATIDPGTQLRHPQTGLLFEIANSTTLTIPGVAGVDPDSFVDADIAAVDSGSQTRLRAGETLVYLTPPAGIEPIVTLVKDLDEDGFDDEQFGSYRGRFLSTLSTTPSGGNKSDFAAWVVQALPAIAKGYSFPIRAGRGSIDVAGFHSGDGAARALLDLEREQVLAYIRTKAPYHVAGDGGDLRCLITVPDPQRIEITIVTTGVPAFRFDWLDGGFTVAAYDPATRELQFNAALPGSLRAGSRVVFDGDAGGSGVNAQDGTEYKIEAITGSDTVVLERATTVDLDVGDKIYSGGPLTTPIRDAIVAHVNGELVYAGRGGTLIPASKAASSSNPTGPSVVGLSPLADGMGPANPGGIYGDWAGGIIRATLFKLATYKAGVQNINIVSPATDYFAEDDAFPNDDQIHYVTPLVVLIRSA
jgi:uncharacterized phage protein gp47/JayE